MSYNDKFKPVGTNVSLVSNGNGSSTKIFVDGVEMRGIEKITIEAIVPGTAVRMHITITEPEIQIKFKADPTWGGKTTL